MKLKKILLEVLSEVSHISENKATSFSSLTYDDLLKIAEWGLSGEFSESGAWDETDNIEEASKLVADSFKSQLDTPFPQGLKGIPKQNIPVYRVVALKSPEELNKKNLGKSWFTDISRTSSNDFYHQLDHLKSGNIYIIQATAAESNVDIPRTLWQRDINWAENELVVKDGSKVNFIKLTSKTY